jgi:hypothetical protein
MRKFLVPLIIILISTSSVRLFAQDDTRATATWQVQKYDIVVTLPSSDTDRSITSKANLTVKNVSSAPATTLTLRISPNAEITAVSVGGATAEVTKREEKVGANGTLQRATVRVSSTAPGATLNVTVDYKLNVKENTGLASVSATGSSFLPLSYWYPTPNSWYFARGADYAPFSIAVAGGSGELITAGDRRAKDVVIENKLSGQPFFLTGNWDTVNVSGVDVRIPKGAGADARLRADELAKLAVDAKTFIAGILGTAPDVPIRIVSTRRGSGYSQGGTVLVDESVFRRSKIDSLTAMNIAEAMAKMWIGGAASIVGDGQGVVREGLPRFIATEFIENRFGKDVADVERTRQRMAYFAVARRDSPLASVSPLDDYYYPEVANKGAMVWRLVDRRIGRNDFAANIQAAMKDRQIDLAELRAAFSSQKDLLDYQLDQTTDTNLLIGLPQSTGAETKMALKNDGGVDATVTVEAVTATGERLKADATIRASNFGEVAFKTPAKITRVEVDSDKLYPQIEYSDDIAPKESSDSDPLLTVKKLFDKQDFAGAEKAARLVLARYPRHDEVRVLLARSLLALNRDADAGNEFKAVLDEKLPAARSIAWANEGLGEIAAKAGQNPQAAKYAEAAILADAEYGASLAARNVRNKANSSTAIDADIKDYFARFDKAAAANRKAEVDALVMPGEVGRFVSSVAGSTQQWTTQVKQVDKLDANTALVETNMTIQLLNREPETGTAVFRLVRTVSGWKLVSVDMFEVR